MEHTYKAPNNFHDRLTKKRLQVRSRKKWRIYTRQFRQMVVHCLSSVRLVRSPAAAWWRSPLTGYAVALLLQILCLLLFTRVFPNSTFPDGVLLLIVLVIALVWGIAPGILATFAGMVSLNSLEETGSFSLPSIVEMVLFLLTGLTICMIVCHIEFARAKAERMRQLANEREKLFHLLAENAQDVIYRYRLSPTFACEYISPSATTVTGYTPEEYYADPCLTLRRFHPGDWPILEGYRHGIHFLDDPLIMRSVHKNGNVVWMEQRNKLIYDQDGNVVALEGISRDITARKQAEETLRASEAMYRTIVHTANEGIWLVDREAHTIFANDHMAAMLGYTVEEMAEHYVTDLVFPEYVEATRARIGRNLQGNFEQFDCRFRRKDGGMIYTLACTSPVRDGSNNIIGALGMFTDITERKQLAKALAEEVRNLEATFESMTDGVLVYDNKGHILRTNTAYRALIGFDSIPLHDAFTIGTRGDMLALRDERGEPLPYARWPTLRVLNGESLTGGNATDIIVRTFRGYDVQLNVTGTPTYDQEGNITGGVLVFHDVTERRKLESRTCNTIEALLELSSELSEELAQSEKNELASTRVEDSTTLDTIARRLTSLIYQALGRERVSIIVVEPGTGELGSIAFAGVTAEQEQRGQQWTFRKALQEQLQELLLDGRLRSDEVMLVDLRLPLFGNPSDIDGMQKVLLAPILLGKQLIGVLAVDWEGQEDSCIQDDLQLFNAITRRAALALQRGWLAAERAEAHANELALREANRLMDKFIGIAAHEIRTPLTTIKASVQLAHRQLSRLEQRKTELPGDLGELTDLACGLLDRAQRQIEMQKRLVAAMLDVSCIRTSHLEMHPERCNMVKLVAEAVEDQRSLVPERTIACTLPAEEVVVMADMDRVKQVVNNYLSNALKYSEKEKPVEVHVKAEEHMALVQVCDEGPGLPEVEQQRVWERFYRSEGIEVGSGSAVGLGLGLHISRTIIEMQGGRVGVESTPGQGSVFWFTLPRVRT